MQIEVKCFATLARFQPEGAEAYELEDGSSVARLIVALGIAPDEVKIVFVNGRHADPGTVIAAGDRVGLFPAVGGG